MAKINSLFRDMSIRKTFVSYVLITLLVALILSGLTIWGCLATQNWLLPEKEKAVLSINAKSEDGSEEQQMTMVLRQGEELPFLVSEETNSTGKEFVSYTFDRIENSYKSLTPKRQIVYVAASVAMIAMPTLYCVIGILVCAYLFYKHKLKEPLITLEAATDQIARRDLDFEVTYKSNDEFGRLCSSFEDMRAALLQANREMWNMLEERRKLQASIAHDLRNPIAIIRGYAEYLQINLPKDNLSIEQGVVIANNLSASANRLERYTESVRNISNLEALEITRKPCIVSEFLDAVAVDMRILADTKNKKLQISKDIPIGNYQLDTESYSRVIENIFQNAIRFADKKISLSWSITNKKLTTCIADDGPGFATEILKRTKHMVLSSGDEHIGMGLTISEILCQKHGGTIKLSNHNAGGAVVQFTFDLK